MTSNAREALIHSLFEAQVQRSPRSIAVVFEQECLTYQTLNARANQLARHLKTLGVGPDVLVGLCVERSIEMVVGILAILKAGGAYVPLDPAYPKERLAWMLEDSQVPVLLAQTGTLPSLPDCTPEVICLDGDWDKIAHYDEENLAPHATAANLAYIIYTSGSTGKPKGVMIEHRSLVNYTQSVIDAYGMSDGDRVLQFASISFDASAEELYPCLCVGATLVLRTELMLASVATFLQTCQTWQITVLSLPTAYWHEITARLGTDRLDMPSSLRLVIIGGEKALSARLAVWHQQVGHQIRLLNTYGPTESTIIATLYDLSATVIDPDRELLIGKAIANIQTYVLDQQLQLVPPGDPGELCIAGAGLARGYLNRPDLTAEKFVLNPFAEEQSQGLEQGETPPTLNSRLYKTGDLVRQLPDGNLEYLGRIDDQVKIRGFRIELGELEALLGQHPQVETAVVMAREDVAGDKRLVAYVVPKPNCTESIAMLRRFMQEKLPAYMVPSAFVRLDSLPLTVNGKIDRRALPAPDRSTIEPTEYVAPRTATEAQLATIWAEVLKLEQVGITDNFFELGGHSLLGTQIVSRLRDAFQVELPLRQLFSAPTIVELAAHLEKVGVEKVGVARSPTNTIQPIPRTEPLPLSFAQQRLWFLDQLVPNSAFYTIPQALRLKGQLNLAALEQSLNEIVQRHESLRTTFVAIDGQPLQVIAPVLRVSLPAIDLRPLPQQEREAIAQSQVIEAAQQPFDLAQGALFRCHLWQVDDAEYILLLTMHHIVSDGWSIGVLIQELATLYEAYVLHQPSPLPKLAIQYADFAQWQRHWQQQNGLEPQLAYWKQQLADAPALLELPTDYPRPSVQTFRGGVQSFLLPAALNTSIEQLSQQIGVTPFMTLLAAFQMLLYRYTHQPDVVVGSPIANRHRAEVEALIGFFINTLVLRTDLSGNPTILDVLKRVKEVALEAYAHQDLPFEQLVEALQPARNLSYTPLFQVMFVLQNAPSPTLELAGLTLHPLQLENGSRLDLTVAAESAEQGLAQFDITLSLEYTEQGLLGIWEYNAELFNAETIARMAGHYQTLLEGMVAHPEQQLSELPILTTAEQTLLATWNNTNADYTTNLCIHEHFEAQVKRSPHAIAVVFNQTQLTYQELNDRANQLAQYLKKMGVGADVLVGLCVERSPDMIVGLLGILKAGGAYVPIDPTYPKERIASMVVDSQVRVLLTQEKWLTALPCCDAQSVCLDRDWVSIAQEPCEDLIPQAEPNHLAYVIYTSGSTGKPKGVMIEHRSLVNFTQAAIATYGITNHDRVLQFASISFDAAAEEIYPCLTIGGTLVLRTDEMLGSVSAFLQQCQELNLTVLDLPTAYWHQLTTQLAAAHLTLPPSLRLVIIGGEAALPAQVATWNTCVGDRPMLMNTYGPTETTIVATACSLSRPAGNATIPIGCPLPNVQVYVLDHDLQPVPIGVPGELCIGGAGLARGYLNRPELTAKKFIPNPRAGIEGQSAYLYRTGDLVRLRSDGNLEYLGRLDQQVKVRGFRVELGEIESILGHHPDIQEAVVRASHDVQGNTGLVAYVVSNLVPDRVPMQILCQVAVGDRPVELYTEDLSTGGLCVVDAPANWQRGQSVQVCLQLPSAAEPIVLEGQVAWNQERRTGIQLILTPVQQQLLQQAVHHLLEAQGFLRTLQRTLTANLRQFLQSKLPDYMIPSAFMLLTALPMTPNGKIDRKALPTFNYHLAETEADFVAPRTPIEDVMAGIWAEVLGLERVSIRANFFELGGHSLLGVQIISRLRQIFQVDLPLRSLFEAPTIGSLARRLEESTQTQQQSALPLLPVQHDQPLPLSFPQEMMWVLAQLQPNVPYYNHTFALRWSGSLNCSALEQALQEIVQRHEVWRTTYTTVDGLPVQGVQAATKLTVRLVDLRHLPQANRETEALRQVGEDVQRPFDLTSELLLRSTLVQYSETDYQLFITLHHISYDGISVFIFLQELDTLYAAFCAGKSSPLPALPIQYADYAVWQRRWLQPEVLEPHLAYWRQQLADLPTLQLPTDYPRPANPTFAGASHSLALSKELTDQLKALCRKESVTLFITLQAAFQALLARYTGQTDIPVGFITAGRDRSELENLLGFFANFLVLRTDLSNNPSFRELLVRVREVALAAYTHQHVPFQRLVEVLRSDRRLGQNPLYQVMLLLDPSLSDTASGWILEYPSPVDNGTVTCDLMITLSEGEEGLTGQLSYSTELFSAETIARMAGHFQTLLAGIVANPDQTLAALPLLTIAEQQELHAWNQTQVDYPLDRGLHQWIEAQVEQTPDAIAVSFEGQHLTYQVLNQKSNQLAHYLQTLGVKPEVLVGICVDRSLDMTIGLLGILKAGGAYVPFDPSYPSERLAFMLDDSQVPVLLTQAHLVDRLPPHQATVICLDTDWHQIGQSFDRNLDSDVTPENLAYVIYTSGSTGKPKGAMNTHRGICNRLLWMQDEYHLTPDDRVLQKTPFSFDVSVWEFFWTWMNGAQLVMARPEGHKDPAYLVQLIAQQQITTLHFVPSMLQVFLEEPEVDRCHTIRQVMCSGEALPVDLQNRFFERSNAQLHNLYGPTEAAIDVTYWHCQSQDNQRSVPIGRPIANTQIYVLDSHLQAVPIGVVGELYIGGINVARGYLNRPELTAEKFIPSSFQHKSQGSRTHSTLYRTGDLARYRSDGAIEYLGRIDHQVKIRGFRIELGEIETVLAHHPTVQTGVVVDRETALGDKQLVAYVVALPGQTIVPQDLQAFLYQHLPEYMVPSAVVVLNALPVNANGKLDRKALPAPEQIPSEQTPFVAPRTPVEEALATIWQDVLGVEQVGIHDNFLELGGHSLLATQVVSRSRSVFQVEVSLRHLFESPTVAELAAVVEQLQSSSSPPPTTMGTISRSARRVQRSSLQ